jgi:sec-independent protein translocase protein TatB
MEFLGIGPSELVFVIIIALIILGPKDMQKAGRTIGKWMRDLVMSDGWKVFQKTSNELRNLPNRMMREANMEVEKFNRDIKAGLDLEKDLKNPPNSVPANDAPASIPSPDLPSSEVTENTIQPPSNPNPTDEGTNPQKNG